MGTQSKINTKLRKRLATIWKETSGVELSTSECLDLLRRIRVYYMRAWTSQLDEGEIAHTAFFKSMIEDITKILVAVESERVQADTAIAKTIERYPLLLAPREQTDLMHALDAESLEVPDA